MAGLNIPSGAYKINGVDVTSTLKLKQSTGLTYNPANPFVFDKEYQYNNYTLTANITPTYSLTNAIALNFVQITFVGDGTHTVDFSNFIESDLSGAFDITLGVENKVVFYYDGVDVIYSITSTARIATSSITGLLSSTDWTTFNNKQAALVSGTNIKTINSTSLLGSGDITVQPTLVSGTNIKTINSNSLLGSGDISVATLIGYTPYNAANPSNYIARTGLSATSPVAYDNSTGVFSMAAATGSVNGYLTSTNFTNFNSAYTHSTTTTGSVHGSTTIGGNLLRLTNPSAITFPRFNADNTVSALSASDFRTAIGAQVTLVSGTNIKTVNGSSLLGSGDLTISGGVTPTDNIFDWDGTNNWYAPYSTKQAFMSFYSGLSDPTLFDRLNIDARVHAFAFQSSNQIACISNSLTGVASGLFGKTSNGPIVHIYQAGNSELWSEMYLLKLERSNGGSGNLLNNLIEINDNPTTSGTITGKVLTAKIGTTERISLNPRVTNSGTNKAYILDTHNTLSGTTELLSIQNNTVERFRVTPVNTALPAGTSTTFATVGGVLKDFYSDDGTVGTSPTDLYSYTLPANVLVNNGDKLIVQYDLENQGTSNISLYSYFAGNLIGNAYTLSSTTNDITVNITYMRSGTTTLKCSIIYTSGTSVQHVYDSETVDFTTTNILKMIGVCSSGGFTARMGYIEYKPAAIN